MGEPSKEVAEARQAVDEVIGAIRAMKGPDVVLDKDTFIEVLTRLRSWIKDRPAPYQHVPFRDRIRR